jgi:hypothetical protein
METRWTYHDISGWDGGICHSEILEVLGRKVSGLLEIPKASQTKRRKPQKQLGTDHCESM